MKKLIQGCAAFGALQLVILSAVIALYPPPRNSYFAATIDKHAWLETAPSPRMIFIGGSNLAFGLDGRRVRDALSYYPVNMAMHADFGMDFVLNEVEDELREDDIVVLSFEYQHYCFDTTGDVIFEVLNHRPANFKHLSTSWFLDHAFDLVGHLVKTRLIGIRDSSITVEDHYLRTSFDAYGSVTSHWTKPAEDPLKFGFSLKDCSEKRTAAAVRRLNEFAELCERRGVLVCYFHPAVPEVIFERWRRPILRIHETLGTKLRIAVLNNPGEMAFPISQFFDTQYHLTLDGTRRRTNLLIQRASGWLEAVAGRLEGN